MHPSTVVLLLLLMASATIQQAISMAHFFDIQGKLDCKLQKKWCWEVEETENSHRGRRLLKVDAKGCSMRKRARYSIAGNINVDGSGLDYEFGLILTHSCTPTGTSETVRLPSLWKVPYSYIQPEGLRDLKKDFNLP